MAMNQQQIDAGNALLAQKNQQNEIPKFDRHDRAKAQAFVDAVNECYEEPVMDIEEVTSFKIINKASE